jgi:CheY-like chemotaxis protein
MGDCVLLYVEDEEAAVFLLETALRTAALKVHLVRVSDGEEAILYLERTGKYAEAPRPHLVLLDLNLPRRSGFDVLSHIRSSDDLRNLEVVVFTSSALPSDRRRSLALGANEYITKPSSFDSFVDAVRYACSRLAKGKGT